jgi:hypothetical protein
MTSPASSTSSPLVVSYGGGLNSTAMLVGFRDRGIVPSLILFADTGAERPETYAHVHQISAITQLWWGLAIETVRNLYKGAPDNLDDACLRAASLPSLAYGRKACSQRHKIRPQQKRLKQWMRERGITTVTKAIGFDSNERHRTVKKYDGQFAKGLTEAAWYPLVEWGWARTDCAAAVAAAGLPVPGKSACYMCPASKRSEVLALRKDHPELFAKALEIERRAQATNWTKRGLGGENNLWADWVTHEDNSPWLDLEPVHVPCGCID